MMTDALSEIAARQEPAARPQLSGGPAAAQLQRFLALEDILIGFGEGIDGVHLEAGLTWAKHGDAQANRDALVQLFASRWIAAQEEGEWAGDAIVEGARDLDELTAVAAAIATREKAPACHVSDARQMGGAPAKAGAWIKRALRFIDLCDAGAADYQDREMHEDAADLTREGFALFDMGEDACIADLKHAALRAQPQARAWGWDYEICTGCSASLSLADIKAGGHVSCCPERRMVTVQALVDAYEAQRKPKAREEAQPGRISKAMPGATYQKSETITLTASGDETCAELKQHMASVVPQGFRFAGGLDRIRKGDTVLGTDRLHERDQQAHAAFVAHHPRQSLDALRAEQEGGAS